MNFFERTVKLETAAIIFIGSVSLFLWFNEFPKKDLDSFEEYLNIVVIDYDSLTRNMIEKNKNFRDSLQIGFQRFMKSEREWFSLTTNANETKNTENRKSFLGLSKWINQVFKVGKEKINSKVSEDKADGNTKSSIKTSRDFSISTTANFEWPIEGDAGYISSEFGMRKHPKYYIDRMHYGVDISASKNTPVVAVSKGVVYSRGYSRSYGYYVILDHTNGYRTTYAHLNKSMVSDGQEVDSGQRIGLVGSTGLTTGDHLHFEIINDGEKLDPLEYVDR